MRISDWSSDVCSSDLLVHRQSMALRGGADEAFVERHVRAQAGDFLVALGQRALQALVRLPADLNGQREQRNLMFQRPQGTGRASCREGVGQEGSILVGGVSVKKKQKTKPKKKN